VRHISLIGKNWSRGLTAATDPRIARAAASHRGLRYRPAASGDRRRTRSARRFSPPTTNDEWTAELAYAVGLIATDGCLSKDRKTVAQTSKDIDLLRTLNACLGRDAPIGRNSSAFRVQICDVGLYRWLESIGLTPRKSLTLGAVAVPDRVFIDFVRGLLDGDGSIIYTTVVPNPSRYPLHTYPRLRVQFLSASEEHITWLRARLLSLLGLKGWVAVRAAVGAHVPLYALRYSKHESITLLRRLYEDEAAPRLERKWRIWNDFVSNARQTRIWTDRRSSRTV
jgi:hypothetical protein